MIGLCLTAGQAYTPGPRSTLGPVHTQAQNLIFVQRVLIIRGHPQSP